MFRVILFIFSFLLFHSSSYSQVYAGKRIALVIGNSNYQHITTLKNPVNDARLIARTLRQLNFDVILKTDVSLKELKHLVSKYSQSLKMYGKDTIGFVYYAGHGVRIKGLNYLIPIDAKVKTEADVSFETLAANDLLDTMKASGNKTNLIFFDACRNNPFRYSRNLQRGLAPISAPEGSFIVFSAAPGKVAFDGTGENSTFTSSLARNLVRVGVKLDDVIKQVGRDVVKETQQRPWWHTDMYHDVYLAGLQTSKSTKFSSVDKEREPNKEVVFNDSSTRRLETGEIFQDCAKCPKMIVVPSGTYTMGSLSSEKGRKTNEEPRRKVSIQSFAVGQYEVTNEEYAIFLNEIREKELLKREWIDIGENCVRETCQIRKSQDRTYSVIPQFKRYPVRHISWLGAKAYVKWLSKKTGKTYRLLTEAEWEYVASTGSETPYWWGTQISHNQANYNNTLRSVDSYKPNKFGLYNVHGNVWEWVEDCWHKNYKDAPVDGTAWLDKNSGNCNIRVIRGGSWDNLPRHLRSRYRGSQNASNRNDSFGVRIARDL